MNIYSSDSLRWIGIAQPIALSEEMFFEQLGYADNRFKRKCNLTKVAPTPAMWAKYRAAVEGMKALEAYEYTDWGGPDYDTTVPEPPSTYDIEWLETEDEWLTRCRLLEPEALEKYGMRAKSPTIFIPNQGVGE